MKKLVLVLLLSVFCYVDIVTISACKRMDYWRAIESGLTYDYLLSMVTSGKCVFFLKHEYAVVDRGVDYSRIIDQDGWSWFVDTNDLKKHER